jgi:cobyrinic acid a,c-diamide synthase
MMRSFMVSAAARSSGKTTVSLALAALLVRRGLDVRTFKKGPDFIDPQWLGCASSAPCRNLDPRLQGRDGIVAYWKRHARGQVAIVEGNQGLHDGVGGDSNAALANLLGLPVVLVMDARGMGRTAAALALGLKLFDPATRIAGIVLNRVAGARHEATLRTAIETEAHVRVLGAIPDLPGTALVQRHLGLMPPNEAGEAPAAIASIADALGPHLDLDGILALAGESAPAQAWPQVLRASNGPRIGIAKDRAFGFCYADDLEALQEAGATLVPFDTLRDAHLPDVDGVFLAGGFPEMCARELEANVSLRRELRQAIDGGLPVYAECGGLMYLARSLTHAGATYRMAGVLPADAVMLPRPVGKGYVSLEETPRHPWRAAAPGPVMAHEFHYSALENVDAGLAYAYRVVRGHGIDGRHDGIVHRNTLACYAHLRGVGGNDWPARFVAHVKRTMRVGAARAAA